MRKPREDESSDTVEIVGRTGPYLLVRDDQELEFWSHGHRVGCESSGDAEFQFSVLSGLWNQCPACRGEEE